jgi:aarF domain-containing kinase
MSTRVMFLNSRLPHARHKVLCRSLQNFNHQNIRKLHSGAINSNKLSTPRNQNSRSKPKTKLPTKYIAFGTLGLVSFGLYHTNDEFHGSVKHTWLTLLRVNVIAVATVKCFYNYKKTLSKNSYETDSQAQKEALNKCHLKCAKITLKALESNGGIYIKLGQHISAMTYLLPKEWTDTMIPLQDQCPESTIPEIDRMFQEDLGQGINELFVEFDPVPIGVASLAQVHVATLKNGQKVAVKCQHPSLKEFVPLDVLLTKTVFELLDKVFPEYPLVWLGEELQDSIYVELDFTNEAKNAENTSKYFENFQNWTALKIPKVISSNKRILIMEFIKGERLDNLKFMDDNHISRSEVSSCLSHIFNNMIFTPNVGIHCDPHGGNLAIRPKPKGSKTSNPYNFEIILYDHGLYRQITTQMRRDYAHFWLALLDRDPKQMELYAERFAGITSSQFPLFAAAITGRDINTALNYDPSKTRDDKEVKNMKRAMTDGDLLVDLMGILSKIPRVVLLILKTNDLTRNLDESLHNPLGPERTFLIMTRYCAKTVYDEEKENVWKDGNLNIVWKVVGVFKAWVNYNERWGKLIVYDLAMLFKNWAGLAH